MHAGARGQPQVAAEGLEIRLEIGHGQQIGMLIAHPEAAAHVDVAHRQTSPGQFVDQRVDAVAQRHEIHHVENLRADMEMQPLVFDARQLQRQTQHILHLLVVDAELVLGEAGGYVGMRVCSDVGVDTQAYGGLLSCRGRKFADDFQLRRGFDVEP